MSTTQTPIKTNPTPARPFWLPNEQRDAVEEILYAADTFIQPDELPAAPLFLLHAMAAGLPVVVCNSTTQRSHVIDGVTGRVVPPGNSQSLALAITETFRDRATSRSLATAAAVCVKDEHSLHQMAADHLRLFQQLTNTTRH